MFESPDKEWRRLTELYAEKYDEELLELASDYQDLTEMAQQVLRDEMKKRGLGDPTAPRTRLPPPAAPDASRSEPAPPEATVDWARIAQERLLFSERYAALSNEELLDLEADYQDLTVGAKRALCDQMQQRGLGDPNESRTTGASNMPDALARAEAEMESRRRAAQAHSQSDSPHDYSWKVELCELDDWDKVSQLREALRRAGIESWIALQRGPTVYVAADQIEQAQQVFAQPVPQDIIEESKMGIPEYQPPLCPACGAADPALDASDPVNAWHCDLCGKQWSDPVETQREGGDRVFPKTERAARQQGSSFQGE